MIQDSVCSECYACKRLYTKEQSVTAHDKRHEGLKHPQWVKMMALLIRYKCRDAKPAGKRTYKGSKRYFRWHDSGDLQAVWHLANIVEVCKLTPKVKHWLPTHEYKIVADYLRSGGKIPPNLVIRLSADFIGKPAKVDAELRQFLKTAKHRVLTSTVHVGHPRKLEAPKGSVVCLASKRNNGCEGCHACWDRGVKNVMYPLH